MSIKENKIKKIISKFKFESKLKEKKKLRSNLIVGLEWESQSFCMEQNLCNNLGRLYLNKFEKFYILFSFIVKNQF